MKERVRFFLSRLRERLWVKPLVSSLLSIAAALLARITDSYYPDSAVISVSNGSLETLLTIISASMLVMAVFAVGSMLSAYASVSSSATPRAFSIVITDDVSQYALSVFIGAFIFSIIGLIGLMNGFYQDAGRLVLFSITILVFMIVILGFVRWVDNIARLGSLGNTIAKVEAVALNALTRNRECPRQGGIKSITEATDYALYADRVGYLQRVDMMQLQTIAEACQLFVNVNAMVGSLVMPGEPLAYLVKDASDTNTDWPEVEIRSAFAIGDKRTFDEDPRFGLVVLSEIASRALSPAVNDPGTAMDIIGSQVRLLYRWAHTPKPEDKALVQFDRVAMPELKLDDIFDDAFNAIARDGAGTIEVMLRLQKAFKSLSTIDEAFSQVASHHAKKAFRYAEQGLILPEELELLKQKNQPNV